MRTAAILLTITAILCLPRLLSAGEEAPWMLDIEKGCSEAKIYVDADAKAKRCLVANVEKPEGTMLEGTTPPLKRGLYRLTIRSKVSKLNNVNTATLSWKMEFSGAVDADFSFSILRFENAKAYQDIAYDFYVTEPGQVKMSFGWKRGTLKTTSGRGMKERGSEIQVEKVPEVGESSGSGLSNEKKSDEEDIDKLESEPDIAKCGHIFMAVETVSVEAVSRMPITALEVDKIRYKPGEKATVSISVANGTASEQAVKVETVLVNDLNTVIPVETKELKLAADAQESWTATSPQLTAKWGYEVRCRVLQGERCLGERSEYFTVHNNMWAILIPGKMPSQQTFNITPELAKQSALKNKKAYQNWEESGFWAPDEFACFAPKEETWYGGQGRYHGSVAGTKVMIEEGHKVGISYAVYSNIWGGDGPPAFEMSRRYPDLAYPAGFNEHWLDRWERDVQNMHVWPQTVVNYSNPETFVLHGKALIAGAREIGWDAVRYDSHSINDGNAKAAAITKKTVRAEMPDFQFGYNSSTPLGKAEMLEPFKEECEGEGLVMEEGIRDCGKSKQTYKYFAETVLNMSQETRSLGGHFLAIGMDLSFPNDYLYQYIFWLAANTHSAYDWSPICTGTYWQFATKHAGIIWDLATLAPEKPEEWADIASGKENLLMPEKYIRVRKLADGKAQLIVNLINAPITENLNTDEACPVPPPRTGIKVALHPPGYKVKQTWLLTAEPQTTQQQLTASPAASGVEVVVRKLRFWSMVVAELEPMEKAK